MRPKWDPSKLFVISSPLASEGRVPDHSRRFPAEESGVRPLPPRFNPPILPTPLRTLPQLDSFFAARLSSLEISLGSYDRGLLAEAHSVRDALAAAGAHAGPAPDPSSGDAAGNAAPDASSCDAALTDTLRGVYAWSFAALDALFLGECVRPLPKRLASELLDHGSVASMRSLLDDSLAPLEAILITLTRACLRLARPRGN